MKLGNFYLLAVFGVLVALGYAPAALANDIPVKGAFFHVDASDAKSLTFSPSTDGINWVSKWTDTDGGSVFATSDKIPDYNPYLDQMGQRTIVNFGAVATSQGQRAKGVGCGMYWSTADTSIREIFVVYAFGISGGVQHVLTDKTKGTYHFHNAGTTLFNAQYASDNVKNGFIELDLKNVPYNTTIPTNKLMLLHVRTTGNVTASAFGNDRNQYSFGRIRYGEVVVFNKTLSEAEAAQISNYLYDKWISEKPFAMVACSVRNGNFTISGEVLSTAGATGADQVDVYLAQSATEGDFTYEKIASGVKKDGKFLRQFSGLMPGNKRYWSVIVSNNLDGATYSGVAEDRNAPQYLFTRHAELTVPGYQGTSDLVRFPVLVRLKAGSPEGFSYADCAADGSDLRFADSEGKLLPHEIDTWDPAGESCIWVLLPKLTKGATKFNMYWRAVAGATLPPNDPTDVWVDYVGVWHFGEETGNALDSTANHFDGTNTSEATSKAAGKVGYSRQKDTSLFQTGINQLTSKAHPQPLKDPLYFSCSGWMKASSNATVYRQLFSKGDWNAKKGWYVQTQNDTTRMTLVGHNQDTASYNIADIYNAWGYFDCVYNNTTYTVYNNGANTTSAGGTGTKKGAEDSADCSLSFASGLAGQVDEFRIRNGVTTTDRVKADYDTQVSANFIAFGAAETQSFTEPVVGEVAVVVDEQAGTLTIVDTVLATGNGEETVDAYLSFSTNGVALEPVKFAGLRSGALVSHTLSGLTSADKVGFALMVSNSTYGATALNLRETPFNADDINAIVGLLEKADYAEYDPPTMKPGRQMRQDAVTGQYSGFDRLEVEANATGAEGETAWVFYAKTRAELEGEAWKIAKSFHLTAPAVAGVFTLDTDQLEGNTDYFLLPIYETEEGFARGEIVAYKSMPKAIGGLGKGGRIFMAKDGSGDIVHVFDTPGESTFTAPLETSGGLTYLLLGGGGAGGGSNNNAPTGSGGGGGGQFLEGEIATVGVGEVFTINIGLGGTCGGVSSRGGNGQASQLLDKDNKVIAEAIGGGGGGASWDSVTTAGVDGANGGGGARGGAGGKPTVAGGFAGGNGNGSWGGCGGGGAGGVGDPQNGGNANGGNGGLGKASTITGESVLYCGGGAGGGGSGSGGAAGLARGGGGLQKEKGFDGYGGGGGGGRYSVGGAGGCGAFIVRYPLPKGEVFVETKIEQAEIGATDIVLSNLAIISGEAETQVYLAYGLAGGEQGEERLVTESWTGVSPLTIPLTGLLAYSKYEYTLRFRLPSGIEQSWTYSFQTLGPEGTGGDEVLELSTGEKVHIFNTNGVFTAPVGAPMEVEYLIVGGGGASGGTDNYGYSGGGGGGQVVTGKVVVASGARLNIEVGAGGLPVNQARGKDGKDSWIEILGNDVLFETNQQFTAYGGGGGGRSNDGGGGWYRGTGGGGGCNGTRPGGTWNKSGVDLPAKRGGNGGNGSGGNDSGGGGGGAGADGGNASGATAGKGGDGIESFITGKSVWYGGGGGGGRGGAGGKGGGGVGNSGVGQDGLGGGGGGINWTYGTGLRGGSGIVILRYKPLSGGVFAGFAVTNRDFDHVDFACDLSMLAGGLPAAKLEYRHVEGVVTGAWQTVKANWQPPARDSFRDENLKAATEYEYEFRVSAEAVTNSYRGTFTTMGIHGTGGELHELDGGWIYHVFNANETFVAPPMPVEVEYLMVGGGGASGGTDNYNSSGGGGGGQVVTGRVEVAAQGEIVVTVGAGGEPVYAGRGGDGSDSSIEVIGDVQQLETNQLYIAYGGGGGGKSQGGRGWYRGTGGGGGCNGTPAGGTPDQIGLKVGERGGKGGSGASGNDAGGGGGGAGQDGGNASGWTAGKGGDGIESFITGESVWYGGGGGGGGSPGGLGGKGGGGIGHSRTGSRDGEELGPQPGADGFGGGGGGIKWTYGTGVRGGRGVVILRYRALAGEIFAGFAVTNRETDSVTFKGELAALAGGAVAATVDLRYTEKESGVTNFVPNCIANWHPGEARSVTISALKALTEYEYEFSVSAGAATNEYRGTFMTMGIHGTGGELHELDGGWIYHVFNEDGTFVAPPMPVEVEYLLVGGGGAGGSSADNWHQSAGGGGGGQVVTGRFEMASLQKANIEVGKGGDANGAAARGEDGGDSIVEIVGDIMKSETNCIYVGYGGGGGGAGGGGSGWYRGTGGGGGAVNGAGGKYNTSGVNLPEKRGGNGGNAYSGNDYGGGGGGAGEDGVAGVNGLAGRGGNGIPSVITGVEIWYGGGGGGGQNGTNGGAGGKGGGGSGGRTKEPRSGNEIAVQPGVDGLGGGGGGGTSYYGLGAKGGRGVVILRYRALQGEIFADFAVTNRDTAAVTFKGELAALAGGEEAVDIYFCYAPVGGATNEWTLVKEDWEPTDGFSYTLWPLAAGTDYLYFFKLQGEHFEKIFEGRVSTMALHGTGGELHELPDGWFYHSFTNSGVFVAPCEEVEVEYLVVGGGGAGGSSADNWHQSSGGGGGGQVVTGRVVMTPFREVKIEIGKGGAAKSAATRGDDGGDSWMEIVGDAALLEPSTFIIGYGGGGGGAGGGGSGWYRGTGGGGGAVNGAGGKYNMSGVNLPEKRGGNGGNAYSNNDYGGGGGGAGEDGVAGVNGLAGRGGNGIPSVITDVEIWYGGGGGGGQNGTNGGAGGKGGGGSGGRTKDPRSGNEIAVQPGVDGLGGGGGGGTSYYGLGARGGSGIVIVRYRAPAEGVYAKISVSKRESRAMNFVLKMNHLPVTDPAATVDFKFAYHDNAEQSLEELDWQDKGRIVEDFQEGDSASYRLDGIKAGHHYTGIFTVETACGLKRAYTNNFATLGLVGEGGELHEIGDGWYYHSFTNDGVFVAPEADVELEYLVVGGGGAGGGASYYAGGGGGGGAVTTGYVTVTANQECPVTVGIGGIATGDNITRCGSDSNFCVPGENADLDQNFKAMGGGGGGHGINGAGLSRGTGGGRGGNDGGAVGLQGGNGGAGHNNNGGGGGGGAGQNGGNSNGDSTGGKGGDGIMSTITGEEVWYGGGGGGTGTGGDHDGVGGGGGLGGKGGGGRGSYCVDPRSRKDIFAQLGPGQDGFGGGGGGSYYGIGARGGKGVVIVRYRSPEDKIRGRVTANSIGAGYAVVDVETLGDEGLTNLHLFVTAVKSGSSQIYWEGTDKGPTKKGDRLQVPLAKLHPETSYRLWVKIAATIGDEDDDGPTEGTGEGEVAAQFYIDVTTLPVGEMAETSQMEVMRDGTILQTFNAGETFTVPVTAINTSYRYLVVGGGGAGGGANSYAGGGGGGGAVFEGSVTIAGGRELAVQVGAGGVHATQRDGGASTLQIAADGFLVTALGGGGGGDGTGGGGRAGGCGGGAAGNGGVGAGSQGGAGGKGTYAEGGGGGGGASGMAGGNSNGTGWGGRGGDGVSSDISGLTVWYGGGGGGSGNGGTDYYWDTEKTLRGGGGLGGKGGGGRGSYCYDPRTGAGIFAEVGPGTEGVGGGGGGALYGTGANGGRGVVMLRHLPKGQTAEPEHPVGAFTGVGINPDGSLKLTAYTPWAGKGAESVAMELHWGTDRVNLDRMLPLDGNMMGVRDYRFDEVFAGGPDVNNEPAARLYLRLEWESKLKQRYATGVRNILVPLTVQEPLEPGLDRVRRTVNFQGNITVVGWGSSTVKVHYGAAADALDHTIVLATADYGKAPFQYETGALPLNVDGDEIPTLYYQYEIIEVAGGREIRHYHSPIAAVEVFEPQQGDAAYVQGGLVANWDGELNAGAGQPHAAAPEKWVDLVEGREFALSGVAARAEAMVFDGTGFGMLASGDTAATFAQISNGTMEVVLDLGLQEESPLMPVEYLQGNKSFNFNTGYIPNANTELKFKFCSVANGVAWSAPFGAYQDENSVATRIIHNNTSENNFRVYHMSKASGGGNNVALSPFSTGGIVEGSMSRTSATLNGQQIKVTQVAGNATRATIGLMTGGTGSTASGDNSTAKLYYFQILENGTLLHDYVPCRRKRDNAAVFYDRVTGEVLEKSGTGTPVFGVDAPEISLARCESAAVLAQDGGIRLALNEGGREIALGTVAATDAAANDPKLISIIYTNGAPKTVYVNGTRAALGPAGEPEQTPLAEVFEYHLPLTTAGYAGSTELVRFPVLVRISEAFTGFKYADCPDGAELRFTDAEGNLIPHEIETWDPAGESCVWVLLPKLNGRDNALMMHWKKHEGVEMPANDPTDVWVDYVGVWHMSETEGDTAYDSTKNHYDAVYSIPGGAGPVTDPSLGRIGGARLLTGGEFVTTASRLIDGGVQNLTNGQQLTPSGWFYSSVNTNAYYNFIRKCDGWGKAGWYLNTQGNLTTYNIIGGGTANLQYNGATFYQTRFLHTATYNGRTFVLYRNGSQVASKGDGSPASESTDVLYLCTYLTGYCDEVRIYNGTASADRVRADYDSQTSANFLFAGVAWRTPKSVVPEGEDGAMRLGAASGDYGAFVGAVRSLRLYDRPLSTEEIALNQGVDRDRFAGNRKSASSARAWTRVDSASGANVIEPFPYNILADARQELSAGTASSPYTSPTMLVDGNINQGNGYGINTGATLTYTFPAVVETMFDLRIVNAGVSGRRSSNVTKVEAVDDDGRVFTLAGAAGLNPTAGPIGYLWLRAADQSPIAYNVKKLIITFGSMENGWALFTEVEATGSPYDEARLKEFAAKRRLYGDDWEVQDPAVFVPTNYVFGAIYDPADKNQTVGDAYMTIYYSPDAAAISNHWTTCPAFTSAYDRAARTFAEWAGPMLSETDYYLRAVYIRENSDGIIAARSEVLRYLSVNLENSIFGDGGRMKMTEDDTGDILHIFDTAGDFAFTAPYTESVAIDYLVVGAGGAGANGTAGNPSSAGNGGGGGEAWTNEAPVVVERGEECQIAVGAGSPAPGTGTRAVSSRDGEQSSITIDGEADVALGGARATAFGNAGGDGRRGLNLHSGATGGAGLKCEITGEMVGYAGGGSAGSMNTSGTYAGVDGGGRGASTSVSAESGVRGGGGGGGNNTNAGKAAAGGDGVVIVRHPPTTAEMRATVKTLEARAHFIGVSVRADVIIVDDPRKFREATAEVYFGFGEDPEALEYRLVAEALPLDATWTTNVVSLTPEKTYYYGVVVSNAATQVRRKGAAYTGEATTEPEPDPNLEPMITLVSVTSAVDRISADVLYDTTYAGLDRDYVDVYLLYGDEPDALGNERQIATNVVGYGLYNLDELKLNTNQYVQVFASNDTGKVWSEVKSVFLEAAPKIGDNCRTWWTGATVGESGFAFTILDPGPVGCPGVSDAMVTLEWGVEPNEEALVNHTVIGDDYRVAKEFTFTRNDGFPKTFYYRFRIENFVTHKTGDYNFFSYTPIFRGGGWTLKFNDMSTVAGTITDGDWIFNVAVMRELITVKDVNKAGTDPKVDFAMPVATALRKYFIDAIGDTCFFANTTPNNNARKVMKQCILPDELSSIGYQAFQNLQVLEYLSPIPPRIKALKYGVIYNCPKLTELNLGKVEIVGGDCCGNNAALTNVVAAALTNVGHKAFIGLPALKSITLGSGAVWCDNVDDNGVIATGATGKGFELHFGREPMMRTKGKVFKCLISGQAADPCRIFVDSPRAIEAWKREMKTAEVTDSDLKMADKYGIRREWVFGIYQDRDSSTPRHLLINGSRIPLVIKVR